MATVTPSTAQQMPEHLQQALDDGYLTQEQLRELIAFQAGELGLGFDEAVQLAREDRLPRNAKGTDLRMLASLLAT